MDWQVESLAECDSTNDELRRRAASGSTEGLVIIAKNQNMGRGRQGRTWVSLPGDHLYASMLLRPQRPVAELSTLSLVVGLAWVDALNGMLGAADAVQVKWPNDLWVGQRKVGGILVESTVQGDRASVVVGCGINVNVASEAMPEELREIAASLQQISQQELNSTAVLEAGLAQLEERYAQWQSDGFGALVADYNASHVLTGRTVTVDEGAEPWSGQVLQVDAQGLLQVRLVDLGVVRKVASADVHLTVIS